MSQCTTDSLDDLKAENARLVALLDAHGIEWRLPPEPVLESVAPVTETVQLSPKEKVSLFRRLFRGRDDVFPVRWESKTSGKAGYSPACANEWRAGICHKPRIKCGDCNQRLLEPLTDDIIYRHLAGDHTVWSTRCYPTIRATSLRSILTSRNGEMTPRRSCVRASSLAYLRRWKYLVPAVGRTPGYSSPIEYQRVKRDVWVQQSSATLALRLGSSYSRS